MSLKYFDVVVPNEYEIEVDGKTALRTSWNKVGRAWSSKTPGSYNFELFLMPGVRYLLNLREKEEKQTTTFDEIPF